MNWSKIPGTEVKKMSEQSQIDKDEALEAHGDLAGELRGIVCDGED